MSNENNQKHEWRVRHMFTGHLLQIRGGRPADVSWTMTKDLATVFDKARAKAVADAYIALAGDHDIEIVGDGE